MWLVTRLVLLWREFRSEPGNKHLLNARAPGILEKVFFLAELFFKMSSFGRGIGRGRGRGALRSQEPKAPGDKVISLYSSLLMCLKRLRISGDWAIIEENSHNKF